MTVPAKEPASGMEGEGAMAACSLLEMSQTFETPLTWDYYSTPSSTLPEDPDRERTFCSDFACCGQTLPDLHALLQHYEERHVKLEDGGDAGCWPPMGYGRYEGEPYDFVRRNLVPVAVETQNSMMGAPSAFDTTVFRAVPAYPVTMGGPGMLNYAQNYHHHYYHPHQFQHYKHHSPYSPGPSSKPMPPPPYAHHLSPPPITTPMPALSSAASSTGAGAGPNGVAAAPGCFYPPPHHQNYAFSSSASPCPTGYGRIYAPPKRPRSLPVNFATDPRAISTLKAMLPPVLTSGPPENSLRLVHTALSSTINPPRPTSGSGGKRGTAGSAAGGAKGATHHGASSDEEGTTGSSKDRPYVCPVEGCGKTYKNSNGLKYHTVHGHDRDGKDVAEKPHRCPFAGCAKRYKNPNGLKYHILHGHPGQTPPNKKVTASLNSIARLDGLEAAFIRAQALAAQNLGGLPHRHPF